MATRDPLQAIEKRTQRYWYEDGIWEIGFGLVNGFLGLFYLLNGDLERGTPLSQLLVVAQMLVIIGGFLLMNKFIKFMKERITYPRTGYVAYRKPPRRAHLRRILLAMLFSGGVAAMVGIVAALRMAPSYLPMVISVVFAAALIYFGYRFDLVRMYVVGVLVVVLAFGISRFPLNEQTSTGVFFSGLSLLMLGSGGLTLANYLRHTRPIAAMVEEDLLPDDYRADQRDDQ